MKAAAVTSALGLGGSAAAQLDVRDIQGPVPIPSIWPALLLAAAAAALLLTLGAVTYCLVRRLRRQRLKTAAERALERLERARGRAGEGIAAELASELSDAVREYIEARFELRAAHRTTEEFLGELVAASVSPVAEHRDPLGEFLRACDLAKFARFGIDPGHMRAMIDAAQSFVRATDAPRAAPPDRIANGAAASPQEART